MPSEKIEFAFTFKTNYFLSSWEANTEVCTRKIQLRHKLIWCNEILKKQGSKTLLWEVSNTSLSRVYTRSSCFKQVRRYRRVLKSRKVKMLLLHQETVLIESLDWNQLFLLQLRPHIRQIDVCTINSIQNHC